MSSRGLVAALALVAGCGSATSQPLPPSDRSDAGASDAAGLEPLRVEVGTGIDRYEPLADGASILLRMGPQGGGRYNGYHVFGAVQIEPVGASPLTVILSVTAELTGEELSRTTYPRLAFQRSDARALAWALQARLTDCCKAEGSALILRAEVAEAGGRTAIGERRVTASPECPRSSPTVDVCP